MFLLLAADFSESRSLKRLRRIVQLHADFNRAEPGEPISLLTARAPMASF